MDRGIAMDLAQSNEPPPLYLGICIRCAAGRMGRLYYARASGDAVYTIHQPVQPIPIGFDGLPEHFIKSKILTANDLGALASVEKMPEAEELIAFAKEENMAGSNGFT